MDVWFLTPHGVASHDVSDLDMLLHRDDGFVWIDIADCDAAAVSVLSDTFGLHPRAVADCAHRNQLPKVHAYRDHVFVVVHAPELGAAGHVHYVELDQFNRAQAIADGEKEYLQASSTSAAPAATPR